MGYSDILLSNNTFYIYFLILYFVGMTFWCFNIPRNDSQMDSALDFYNRYTVYMTMILPILIGTVFIKAYSDEYRNNTLYDYLMKKS